MFYIKEKSREAEGPFLKEERWLINGICESLGRYLERLNAIIDLEKKNIALEVLISQFEAEKKHHAQLSDIKIRLSAREIEVCSMICRGLSSKQIAGNLNLSVQTIDSYRKNIRKKLDITDKSISLSSYLQEIRVG